MKAQFWNKTKTGFKISKLLASCIISSYKFDFPHSHTSFFPSFQGPRGRGGPPPMSPRGGRGGFDRGRGTRGQRGMRGATGRGARGGAAMARGGPQRGGKRKAGGDHNQGMTKRRNTSHDGNWGAQPIAQQPLDSGYNDSQWYQDSYGQQWS